MPDLLFSWLSSFRCLYSCPDISIASLQRDNGQGFIDLVRQMVQSARSFDKHQDYYPIISEKFDKYFRIERNDESQKLPLDRGTRMFQSITQHRKLIVIFIEVREVDFSPSFNVQIATAISPSSF